MSTDTSAKATPGRTAYLVLGMHRSGTSAATQMLALAGARLPSNLMPGDEHNAKGYFEPWKIALFNDQRLRAGGGAWDDVFAFPHRPLPRKAEREWLNRAAAVFAEEYGEAAYPLLKDPRATVLLPFWRTALADLGVAARCVISVRHPLAVAGSLSRRNGFAVEKSLLLWSAYMLAAEAYTRDLPRAFVAYDALLSDWRAELARMEAAHGAGLPPVGARAAKAIDRFLTTDLRHNTGEAGMTAYGWAGALTQGVYDWFADAAADRPADPTVLDAAGRALARRQEEVGVLVSPVARDLDAARAEILDLKQRRAFEHDQELAAVTALVDSILAEG
ncbi:hypothetical protein [Phenylobacterium sp.]|jgi:hypothetical protein|uniref:sulfotransferase family protein n=1 Tax=Phenylobacterium sp. TaxID=1871053 RepID=UPI002F3FE009